jgi:hypothetical protein
MLFKTTFQTTCALLYSTLHSNKIDYPCFSVWKCHAVDIVVNAVIRWLTFPSPVQTKLNTSALQPSSSVSLKSKFNFLSFDSSNPIQNNAYFTSRNTSGRVSLPWEASQKVFEFRIRPEAV